jgi:CheY-like chemotaxis protein
MTGLPATISISTLKPILLVEDNLNDVELVLNALKRNRLANQVDIARHGGQALDYLYRRGLFNEREGPDPAFILLDLKMPKVDGLQVLEQIKSDPRLRLIPIVMLTTSTEETDLVKSYQLGVNAYVVKPVDFLQFVEAIKQIGLFWAIVNVAPPTEPF